MANLAGLVGRDDPLRVADVARVAADGQQETLSWAVPTQGTRCTVLLTKVHVEGALWAPLWPDVATPRTVMPRWTRYAGMVPVGTEVTRWTLPDAFLKQGPLVTDHAWTTFRRHHPQAIC